MGNTKPVVKVVIKCSLEFSLLIGGLKSMTNMVEKATILQKINAWQIFLAKALST